MAHCELNNGDFPHSKTEREEKNNFFIMKGINIIRNLELINAQNRKLKSFQEQKRLNVRDTKYFWNLSQNKNAN